MWSINLVIRVVGRSWYSGEALGAVPTFGGNYLICLILNINWDI